MWRCLAATFSKSCCVQILECSKCFVLFCFPPRELRWKQCSRSPAAASPLVTGTRSTSSQCPTRGQCARGVSNQHNCKDDAEPELIRANQPILLPFFCPSSWEWWCPSRLTSCALQGVYRMQEQSSGKSYLPSYRRFTLLTAWGLKI